MAPLRDEGLDGRLAGDASDELAAAAFRKELRAARFLFPHLVWADLAQVAALVEAAVLERSQGAELVDGLLDLYRRPPPESALSERVGDVYNNWSALVAKRVGPKLAGALHAGRARREAMTIAWQLAVRERLLGLGDLVCVLVSTLVEHGETYRSTLIPDYTYLQRAHPTTLAHYLLGFAFPMTRDLERIASAFQRFNASPAGSGSVNGSQLGLDRRLLADLLGFEGLVLHNRDAMWQSDLVVEAMGVVVSVSVTADRFAEDLQIWATREFGFVELDDSHSRASVIMPQKKNPFALTYLRGHGRSMLGRFSGLVAANLTPTGQPDNRSSAYYEIPDCLEESCRAIALLTAVLTKCKFRVERMAAAASEGYLYATDLCDELTRRGIDNRRAHRIVGRAIRRAIAAGEPPITGKSLRDAASELGIALPFLDDDAIENLRDVRALLALRRNPGSTGEAAMEEMSRDLTGEVNRWRELTAGSPARGLAQRLSTRMAELAMKWREIR